MISNTPPIDAHTKYQGYGNEAFDVINRIVGQLNTEGDINMELWVKYILDKTNQFNIGTPPVEEPSITPCIYIDGNTLIYIDENNNRTTYTLASGAGDMLKSIYDTNNDGIVNSAHKEIVSFVNKTGATLTKGTIVYLKSSSSSGTHPEALKANATTEAMSSKTVGAIYEDVANDATGYIVTSGEVDNLNTSSYTIGTKLWLSTTDGLVTTTAPTAPNHAVFIGTVTRSQTTNGRILYAIQNGYEYEELHNVSTTAYTAIQDADLVSIKEIATSLWKPSTWSNIKSVLKTYFDTLYQPLSTVLTNTTASFTTVLKSTYDSTTSSLTSLLATGSRLITSAEITKLSNTSGTNTGDQTSIVGIAGTKAQFDTACTDDNFAFLNQAQIFTATQTFNASPRLGADDLPLYMSTANAGYIRGGNSGYIVVSANALGSGDKSVYIETPDNIRMSGGVIVNGQNRTNGWTSWTPTVSGSGGSIGSYTDRVGYYKLIGKTCIQAVNIYFDKGTLSGPVTLSNAVTVNSNMLYNSAYCTLGNNNATTWYTSAEVNGGSLNWIKNLGVGVVQFSDMGTNIRIRGIFIYETI